MLDGRGETGLDLEVGQVLVHGVYDRLDPAPQLQLVLDRLVAGHDPLQIN